MSKETRRRLCKHYTAKGIKNPYFEEFKDEFIETNPSVHSGSFKKGHARNTHDQKDHKTLQVV